VSEIEDGFEVTYRLSRSHIARYCELRVFTGVRNKVREGITPYLYWVIAICVALGTADKTTRQPDRTLMWLTAVLAIAALIHRAMRDWILPYVNLNADWAHHDNVTFRATRGYAESRASHGTSRIRWSHYEGVVITNGLVIVQSHDNNARVVPVSAFRGREDAARFAALVRQYISAEREYLSAASQRGRETWPPAPIIEQAPMPLPSPFPVLRNSARLFYLPERSDYILKYSLSLATQTVARAVIVTFFIALITANSSHGGFVAVLIKFAPYILAGCIILTYFRDSSSTRACLSTLNSRKAFTQIVTDYDTFQINTPASTAVRQVRTFDRVDDHGQAIIVRMSPNQTVCIPKRGFATQADQARFVTRMRAAIAAGRIEQAERNASNG
jgi:hypothetical protein